jgi:FADH2 O2-dependent halogenase
LLVNSGLPTFNFQLSTFKYDVAIAGSGFGGSLMAMVARRIGMSVLLLERGTHPRFAIGESTSPLTNLLIEEIATRYDLPRLLPLTSYGPWQRTYPHLVCGLKRGFTFFHHEPGERFRMAPDRRNHLMVAANPNDELADMHWLRADVDEFLMREAVRLGADYLDDVHLAIPTWDTDHVATITGASHGEPFQARARLLIDATGPRGFLARALSIPEAPFVDYPATQTLYSHFTGIKRCDSMPDFPDSPSHIQGEGRGEVSDPSTIHYSLSTIHSSAPPYPMDDAALHHVFDGGWMWVLRFGNGVTSAGVAATDRFAGEIGLSDGEPAWRRFLARFPSIGDQFADAVATRPFVYAPRLAYRAAQVCGPGWVMLPSAAAFIDPLFSTGIPLTLLGIERIGRILEESWDGPEISGRLEEYAATTRAESDATGDLIGASYAAMQDFRLFTTLSMFYFTAASFSEMARRLKKPLVRQFLACGHPIFGPAMARACADIRPGIVDNLSGSPFPGGERGWGRVVDAEAFLGQVADATACLNVAGLCDRRKRNWYGVDMADLIASSEKLGHTPDEMRAILRDASWAPAM